MKKLEWLHRVIQATVVLPLLLGCSISQAAGYWVSESFNAGKEGALCRALHKRLNEMAKGTNPACMSQAIATYPEFSDPPWEELDPREHFELLVKLMKFAQEGEGYFGDSLIGPNSGYRTEAENFITHEHGQMQVWRTKLLSGFQDFGKEMSRDQAIVKLIYRSGTSASADGCPDKASLGWVRFTFIVKPDLSDLDKSIANGTGRFSFKSHWPVLYDGKAVLIDPYSVHWPGSAACMYQFVETTSRKSTEK